MFLATSRRRYLDMMKVHAAEGVGTRTCEDENARDEKGAAEIAQKGAAEHGIAAISDGPDLWGRIVGLGCQSSGGLKCTDRKTTGNKRRIESTVWAFLPQGNIGTDPRKTYLRLREGEEGADVNVIWRRME
ncbi:hypothetical protein DEU56DRAFT_901311 [Suillus clintonianus]|uniref:uncharacterized protein n=1 Tax=Suillus clintonianus TaxID=1904413 RepID=UPI001B866E46|nr:uncharacterized protein DEU56DRAFT_901311 [Suillus clintonianus]KAG2138337.1 hypothetical protein DEU56DRAFT_901311 [Suillus clintonianus]